MGPRGEELEQEHSPRRFANDLGDDRSSAAVTDNVNQDAGAGDPAEWLPPRNKCRYSKHYVAVKLPWRLALNPAEKQALHRVRRRTHRTGTIEVRQAKVKVGLESTGGGGGGGDNCSPAYPDFCIPPPPQIWTAATSLRRTPPMPPPDPHGFDGDGDGDSDGCET